ncbi:MAG TPA: BrnA antitoxin family protein [Stellaceae bacterium]
MRKANSKRLSATVRAELEALKALPDDQIDTSDMPEITDWSGAKRGVFYRPLKQQITLRLDSDIVTWFRKHAPKGAGYQTNINLALREHVTRKDRKAS